MDLMNCQSTQSRTQVQHPALSTAPDCLIDRGKVPALKCWWTCVTMVTKWFADMYVHIQLKGYRWATDCFLNSSQSADGFVTRFAFEFMLKSLWSIIKSCGWSVCFQATNKAHQCPIGSRPRSSSGQLFRLQQSFDWQLSHQAKQTTLTRQTHESSAELKQTGDVASTL